MLRSEAIDTVLSHDPGRCPGSFTDFVLPTGMDDVFERIFDEINTQQVAGQSRS